MTELVQQHLADLYPQLLIGTGKAVHKGSVVKYDKPAQIAVMVVLSQNKKVMIQGRRMQPAVFPDHDTTIQFPEEHFRERICNLICHIFKYFKRNHCICPISRQVLLCSHLPHAQSEESISFVPSFRVRTSQITMRDWFCILQKPLTNISSTSPSSAEVLPRLCLLLFHIRSLPVILFFQLFLYLFELFAALFALLFLFLPALGTILTQLLTSHRSSVH